MTNSVNERNELSSLIQYLDLPASDGSEYAIEAEGADAIAEDILDAYLIIKKADLPEAKIEGGTIYAGNQAIPTSSKVDDLMDRALSYLAAATVLVVIEEKRKEEEKREQDEILTAFNSLAQTKRNSWSTMTANEQLAGREIVRLRGLAKTFF
jgi:hypothetical protein